MTMTPVQFAFAVGLGAVAIIGFAALIRPHHIETLKADRIAASTEPRVIRVIPLTRQPVEPPTPRIEPLVKLAEAGEPQLPLTPAAPTPRAEPPTLNERELTEPDTKPVAHDRKHSGGDICARTGGRKVETHGGKSWRCQYARR